MSAARVIASFRRAELPEARVLPVIHPPGHLVVVRVGGRVFALDHACCHGGASLLNGQVRGATITCRAHGYCFDLASGAMITPKGESLCQGTWPVERRGEAWVVLEREG